MRRMMRFIGLASASGWRWLVEVSNHVGAAAFVLAAAGVSVLSAVKLPHWWLGLLIAFGFYAVLFCEGAYRIWNDAGESARPLLVALPALREQPKST